MAKLKLVFSMSMFNKIVDSLKKGQHIWNTVRYGMYQIPQINAAIGTCLLAYSIGEEKAFFYPISMSHVLS